MLIVTPNPAVDHTVWLAELRPGEVIRTGPGRSVAGGKGGNVARAAKCLGVHATVLALVPEIGGEHLRSLYAAEGFELAAIPVAGRVRTCTALLEDGGRVTLLNEPGPDLDPGDWDRLLTALTQRLTPGEPIVCSGSLPPGAPAEGYARIVIAGHARGSEVLVDAAGAPLAHALAARPDFVCPNLSEAERMLGGSAGAVGSAGSGGSVGSGGSGRAHAGSHSAAHPGEAVDERGDDVPDRAMAAARRLHDGGAAWAAVTAGAAGVAVAGPGVSRWIAAVPVTVRNPIGAGDSFLAGVATARQAGKEWLDAVPRGVAAAGASVEQDRAGVLDPRRMEELRRHIPG